MPASGSNSKKLVWVTGIVALVLAFSTVYLVHYYGGNGPAIAQVQTGHVHPAKIHERTVYLTTGEYSLVLTMHVIAIVAMGVFVGVSLRSVRKDRAETTTPKA